MLINAATLPDVDKIVQSAQKATEESKNQTKEAQFLTKSEWHRELAHEGRITGE